MLTTDLTESERRSVEVFQKYDWVHNNDFTERVVLKIVEDIFSKLEFHYGIPKPKIVFGKGCNEPYCMHTTVNLIDGEFVVNVNWFTTKYDIIEVFQIYSKCFRYKIPVDYEYKIGNIEASLVYSSWDIIDPNITENLRILHAVCLTKRLEIERDSTPKEL